MDYILDKRGVETMKRIMIFLVLLMGFLGGITNIPCGSSNSKYSMNGDLIKQIQSQIPNYTTIDKIPNNLKNAVIATEDKRFYRHHGFDMIAIARAIYTDVKARKFKEGGSTITQQLAKNLFLANDKSFKRKFKELIFASKLENKYTKNQILEMYLNVIYYGGNVYGAENASKKYFNKDLKNLTLGECAMLAGIPQCPSYYYAHPSEAKKRQQVVLEAMIKNKFINKAAQRVAQSQPVLAAK
jgi:membrane peptidoglycan carboxypeptidase